MELMYTSHQSDLSLLDIWSSVCCHIWFSVTAEKPSRQELSYLSSDTSISGWSPIKMDGRQRWQSIYRYILNVDLKMVCCQYNILRVIRCFHCSWQRSTFNHLSLLMSEACWKLYHVYCRTGMAHSVARLSHTVQHTWSGFESRQYLCTLQVHGS